jgi:hypothetical protein
MPYQNIDASVSPADLQAIKDAFATIQAKLPFLITLTTDERKSTFKAGPNSLSFVQNALSAAEGYSQIIPPSFSTTAFRRDVDLFMVLTEVTTLAESLFSQIDDTRLAVGGEAMRQGSQVYKLAQAAENTVPGLKPVVDQLSERFQKTSKPTVAATPNSQK